MQEMVDKEVKGLMINICQSCNGSFIPPDIFHSLMGFYPAVSREMKCPYCDSFMYTSIVGNVETSTCPGCEGVWVEREYFETLTGLDYRKAYRLKWVSRRMTCPTCRIEMATLLLRGIEIDMCAKCGRMWFDREEFTRLTNIKISMGRRLKCPLCGKEMLITLFKSTETDVCPSCSSVWLDSGELESLSGIQKELLAPPQKKTLLGEILEANNMFAKKYELVPIDLHPKKKVAVLTCMDTRLINILELGMGLKRGDVVVIKNAGCTITGSGEEILRSMASAVYLAGVEEIFVVGHTDCLLSKTSSTSILEAIEKHGIDRGAFPDRDLMSWFGGFMTEEENVKNVVRFLRGSKVIPKTIPVHGLLMNPNTGKLSIVVSGYEKRAQKREIRTTDEFTGLSQEVSK
ncbi:MAG: zf-TFIIB domain-containing protein [Candidatus Thermoplasmatota archaeon]